MSPEQPQNQPIPSPVEPPTPPAAPQLPATPPTDTPLAPTTPQAPVTPPSVAPLSANSTKKSKAPLIIIIVVVAVLLLGGATTAIFLLTRKKGGNPITNAVNSVKGTSDVEDRSDGTLNLSGTLIDEQDTIKTQDLKAKLNQQVNLSNGDSYMITAIERNFVSSSRYLKASSGKELVKVSLVVGSRNKDGNYYASTFGKLRAANGAEFRAKLVSKSEEPEAMQSGEIAGGQQQKGFVIFEVTKDEKPLVFATEDKYKRIGGNGEEVTLKSQVTLE